ncbi:hypothetical protein SAMN05428642_103110 [Flaviramulus basaltis]|uniref:Lipoprotein n=1 Tax=Flaviramulus basaltis TaxID=369401 RepID=A0A1K2ILQ4_9FLAO|nr:hypothetical protein [Flaviramulus basaltis]SFZ93397.1 hypothetical protein SAMN05428642_103110 [Flaviramulus basaltis]
MTRNFLKLISILLVLTSCKTIDFNQVSQTKTTQQVVLGSIGSEKEFLLQTGFNNSAVPSYKSPIKLSVVIKPFTKHTHKTFLKAKAVQSANIIVRYVDSLPNKPTYTQLQIADKVELIKALNADENTQVKDYLSHNPKGQVLTGISLTLNKETLEAITGADAVFLVEQGYKTYAIQLYKNKVKTQTIYVNEGIVFEYQTSYCCWQENNKHQLDIVDLVSKYSGCPNNTYRSSKRAKMNINYYKL